MKEIKFRAWDKKKKEWVINVYICNDGWHFQHDIDDYNPNLEFMQYTNIKDRNVKEIYGDDIVALRGVDDKRDYYYKVYQNQAGTWMACNEVYYDSRDTSDFTKYEVIGNIYENPELLEEQ